LKYGFALGDAERVPNKSVAVVVDAVVLSFYRWPWGMRTGTLVRTGILDVIPKWPWSPKRLLLAVDVFACLRVSDTAGVKGSR